jgi:hypothetical protein
MGGLYVPILRSWERMRVCHAPACTAAAATKSSHSVAWPRLKTDMMWCGAGWFCHLSHLMTGVSKVLKVTACDDGSYRSFIHERLFWFCILIFHIGKPCFLWAQLSLQPKFPHPVSCEHGNRGSMPPKPAPILVHLLGWRLAIDFWGASSMRLLNVLPATSGWLGDFSSSGGGGMSTKWDRQFNLSTWH